MARALPLLTPVAVTLVVRGSGVADSVLADPVLANPVLANPVLADSMRPDPVQFLILEAHPGRPGPQHSGAG